MTAVSGWFVGEPVIEEIPARVVIRRWFCPKEFCTGEMRFNGTSWPTGNPGFHHTCSDCGFTTAITDHQYPEKVTIPISSTHPQGGGNSVNDKEEDSQESSEEDRQEDR